MIELDNSQIASLYSQLAGVLAGFAFTAVTVVVTVRVAAKKSGRSFDNALRPLISGFLGLVLTSLNYAAIAGDKTQGARSTLLEIVAGIGFAASALLLIYAVLLMLIATRSGGRRLVATNTSVEKTLRVTMVVVLPVIVLVFLYAGARDHQSLNARTPDIFGAIDVLGLVLVGIQLVLGLISWRYTGTRMSDAVQWSNSIKRYSSLFLGICFLSSVATALITSIMPPCNSVTLWVSGGVLILAGIAMSVTSLHVAGAR
ncbi:hypothetical protein JNUCC0626_47345 [Lentzea sp. JNUCC 0626]|uniref:hypothetical protein n=1 Tax=Lentzea sp. JNUCC 0626 TaxID=3367513 RepID=UPI00374854E8